MCHERASRRVFADNHRGHSVLRRRRERRHDSGAVGQGTPSAGTFVIGHPHFVGVPKLNDLARAIAICTTTHTRSS
jgi:hypothetical protein